MSKKKSSSVVSLILFVFALNAGCARVQIKNAEWCGDMGELGASCFHTLSDESRDLEKEEWDEERFGQVCTKPENFANWKAALLKLCRQTRLCTYEERRMIETLGRRMNHFDYKAARIKELRDLGYDVKSLRAKGLL